VLDSPDKNLSYDKLLPEVTDSGDKFEALPEDDQYSSEGDEYQVNTITDIPEAVEP
jgi:hypothetical protein